MYKRQCSVFADRSLGILESITRYLKDEHRISYSQIARLLNRNPRTIWTAYKSAKRKSKKTVTDETSMTVPISIFRDEKLGPLEVITYWLKENAGMSYSNIARVLNRNPRTIWTSYNRAVQKRSNNA